METSLQRRKKSPTLGASVGVQYWSDVAIGVAEVDAWEGELSVVWAPVENFEVRGEVAYRDIDAAGVDESTSGFLRFTRYF